MTVQIKIIMIKLVTGREELNMLDWTLIFTAVGAIASVISAIVAVRAKNKTQEILEQVKEERSHNIKNSGDVQISNSGINSGTISGINSGDITK